ncbi:MAG: M13 family metallopeptidase N-terminal domain-containing protein [Anaeromyxobacter sp.]
MTTVLVLAALLAAAPQRPPVVPRRAQDERSLAARGLGAAGVDRTADPCTDFHAFASGVWRAGHPLPPGAQRSSPRSVAREANATALEALLAELAARRDWPAGSAEQLAGDAFAACMDERAGDAAGLTPVAPLLASLEAIRTRADVQRAIRQLHAMGIGVGFTAAGGFDYHAPRAFMLGLSAGALGLPDPAQYLGAAPQAAAARARYGAYLARLLELGGTPRARADEAAAEILALETRLAKEALDPVTAQDPAQTDHRTSFAGLQVLAPHLDWAAYLDEAGLPRADLNVAEPKLLARRSTASSRRRRWPPGRATSPRSSSTPPRRGSRGPSSRRRSPSGTRSSAARPRRRPAGAAARRPWRSSCPTRWGRSSSRGTSRRRPGSGSRPSPRTSSRSCARRWSGSTGWRPRPGRRRSRSSPPMTSRSDTRSASASCAG